MAPTFLSRLLPTDSAASPSMYDRIQQHEEQEDADVEERAAMTADMENFGGGHFHDYELEDVLAHGSEAQLETHDSQLHQQPARVHLDQSMRRSKSKDKADRPKWMHSSPRSTEPEDGDDDVPPSLLVEGLGDRDPSRRRPPSPPRNRNTFHGNEPIPGPSTAKSQYQWSPPRQRQHVNPIPPNIAASTLGPRARRGLAMVDPKEIAMWRWANVEHLDNFIRDAYSYFVENGFWSIMLSRFLHLLTLAFVMGFTMFLFSCVDYRSVPHSKTLSEIVVPRCTSKMSGLATFVLWLFTLGWIGTLIYYLLDIRRLRHMRSFYHYLLGVSDTDIQTISWQEIVSRIMTLRDSNPAIAGAVPAKHRRFMGSQSKQRLDAHDIANRIMRQENYLIALFNKDVLDLSLPLPFLRNHQFFSYAMELNIQYCILFYFFNIQGQLYSKFIKDTDRRALSNTLRSRFRFFGICNLVLIPFFFVYIVMAFFFRYFNEYQKNPSQIGMRKYTPLAEWKFREFNELPHLFQRRINMSAPFAKRYIDQFPKDKTVQMLRFVAFISGAIMSVLALAAVIDPELFLGFEITHDRTVLFYLSVFGSIWAVSRGMVPEETQVFDPEFAIREVINFTHYRPAHWQGKLHSDDVRKDFAALYKPKVVVMLEEILGMIVTPFILYFSLPKCSDRLIDFFREFTVHVDGLGYVCSFAVFDFKKGTNRMPLEQDEFPGHLSPADARDDYYSTKDGKMLASYYGFLDNYATDPRTGTPYAQLANRYGFQPPPAIPGLGSPSMMGGFNHHDQRGKTQQTPVGRAYPTTGTAGQRSMTTRTPHAGTSGAAGRGHISPLHSMLLDPHHQPSVIGFRSTTRPDATPRKRARKPTATKDTVPDEEKTPRPSTQPSNAATASSPGATSHESHMEESWRLNLAADTDEGEEDDGEERGAVAGRAGVLNLIHQLQKIGNEGRGGGVGMGI